VQDQVVQIYESFFDSYVSSKITAKNISKKGKSREDTVWDIDTFAEWTEGIFMVGKEGMIDADEDGEDDRRRSRSLSRSGSI
jgi:conserved oligomeric Golgi complex subunit 3